MEKPDEKAVVNRAYELWAQAGRPLGRDKEFYHQAERQLNGEEETKEPPEENIAASAITAASRPARIVL